MASSRSPLPASDDLLHDLLDVSLTGVIPFRSVYDAAAAPIQDFTYEYLNPAAPRLLQLPEASFAGLDLRSAIPLLLLS